MPGVVARNGRHAERRRRFRQKEEPELWALLKQPEHHAAARAAIAERHLEVVKTVAMSLLKRKHIPLTADELVSYGFEGLLNAIDSFDASRGVRLSTYASSRIWGAIMDGIRGMDWVPRLERTRRGDDCRQMLSLQAVITDGDGRNQQRIDFIPDAGAMRAERARESLEAITRMCRGLSRTDQLIIRLYYVEEMTMREIGNAIGMSESRISQLHDQALKQLRARVAREQEDEDEDEIEEGQAGAINASLN